jgi:hypothetical protein
MASGQGIDTYDDDHAVLDDDFLNDGMDYEILKYRFIFFSRS